MSSQSSLKFNGDQVHLEKLLEAVQKSNRHLWNRWRSRQNSDSKQQGSFELFPRRISLSGITLRNEDLKGFNFNNIDFSYADLTGCDLSYSQLCNCDFYAAHLRNTTMINAQVFDSYFKNADFSYAEMEDCNFSGSIFTNAALVSTSLKYSNLNFTSFERADLHLCNITGVRANSWRTTGWKIRGIICKYIFLDENRMARTPAVGNFTRGEFEQLFDEIPNFDYAVHQERDLSSLPIIASILQAKHPEWKIAVDSFNKRKKAITFSVADRTYIQDAMNEIAEYVGMPFEAMYDESREQ